MNSTPRPYEPPRITRVKLEDRAVVAQTACKDAIDTRACARFVCEIQDEFGTCVKASPQPTFEISPS